MAKVTGPKRKPTKDKIALGTFRADRAVVENEVEYNPQDSNLPPPEVLSGQGIKEWNRVAPQVQSRGVMNETDYASLTMYCKEIQMYWEAQADLKANGYYEVNKKTGHPTLNPMYKVSTTALKNAMSIATEFGFTPSSRTRISVKPKKEENKKESALLRLSQG